MDTKTKNIIKRAAKFSSIDRAINWASYGKKAQWVVSDGASFFVVRPVDAARLERSGFAII